MDEEQQADSSIPFLQLFAMDAGLLDVKAFWRTRKAVRGGDALYDFSLAELDGKGLVEPWRFNLQESVIAALPAVLGVMALNFLFGSAPVLIPEGSSMANRYAAEILPQITAVLNPLTIPLILLATAPIYAWATFHKGDMTPEKRRRATKAYLYVDGAYGLWAQSVLVFSATLVGWAGQHMGTPEGDSMAVPMGLIAALLVLGLPAWLYQIWEVFRLVPRKLFKLNGYDPTRPPLFTWFGLKKLRLPENAGPWRRYGVSALYGTGAVSIAITLAVSATAWGASMALGFLKALLLGELGV